MKLTNNLYFYPEQGMLDSNTYVIKDDVGILIDPSSTLFLPALTEALRSDGIEPGDIGVIANTHLHCDHCAANEAFKELSGARISLHPVQKQYYNLAVTDVAGFFGLPPAEFREDIFLDNYRLSTGNTKWELIHSPGHSPDCICFYNRQDKILICGDVLFDQNTGRVDLPGGNADELKKTLKNLSQLDIEYLLPGHMDIVTGAEKVAHNFDFIKGNIVKWL